MIISLLVFVSFLGAAISALGIYLNQKMNSFSKVSTRSIIIYMFLFFILYKVVVEGSPLIEITLGMVFGATLVIVLLGLLGCILFKLLNKIFKGEHNDSFKKIFFPSLFFPIILQVVVTIQKMM